MADNAVVAEMGGKDWHTCGFPPSFSFPLEGGGWLEALVTGVAGGTCTFAPPGAFPQGPTSSVDTEPELSGWPCTKGMAKWPGYFHPHTELL